MKLTPAVKIAPARGGYVVETVEYDPDKNESKTDTYIAVSIEEANAHVARALTSWDKLAAAEYDQIERKMNGA